VKADPEDQLHVAAGGGFPVFTFLAAVAVLVGLLLFWFWGGEKSEQNLEPTAVRTVVLPEPAVAPAPDIPRQAAEEPATVILDESGDEAAIEPVLPSPGEADDMLREQLNVAGADASLAKLVGDEHPLELSAKLIDGLSRGLVLRKILPADPPEEAFSAIGEDDAPFMSAASYERYDSYTDSIVSLDAAALVSSFHSLRPLYERAYEQLGLDAEDFDNAVIRSLDVILSTPEIEDPIALERKNVMYTFKDPELEQLPTLQKQLMRMGPDNIRRIKAQAQLLRDGLLAQ
jgi:hypothetical protein